MAAVLTIVVVMGVAGSGKSTVASLLADGLGWDFVEGDDFHPLANVDKMRRGIPLSDADRAPWLDRLNAEIRRRVTTRDPAVVACSALRHAYRERLRQGVPLGRMTFVFLEADRATLERRLGERERHDHYMPASLLDSQLATLEPPTAAEAVTVDSAGSLSTTIDDLTRLLAAK
jgi:gluconokinase